MRTLQDLEITYQEVKPDELGSQSSTCTYREEHYGYGRGGFEYLRQDRMVLDLHDMEGDTTGRERGYNKQISEDEDGELFNEDTDIKTMYEIRIDVLYDLPEHHATSAVAWSLLSPVSNAATILTREQVSSFLRRLECRHLTTTAYRPQTNGLVERMNQTVVQAFNKIVRDKDDKLNWDKNLNAALLAIRTTQNDTTNFSPAMMLYGVEMRTPSTWPPPDLIMLKENWKKN
ncbi:hypothetical protein K450DRAFT_276045 [Umbelopsis ramanniana AG]|uniref:Integrase catalytic domain-containing protein n=1 Tax=Umbelopsis ramanniana AG TaxID=1314678 RepID=A0AAD5E1B5_UMBRA|nr:uncharacterized protein K450DRAFT_276045 [Umbelopsis ramanniana AG]KAI8574962.1 hypothetical protein K450DRAFT_276045 [Umbelopsis ramanniana AG]